MLVYVRPSNEALPIDFPHFALRGAARLSFTARIEGAHSDRAASASKKDGLAVPLSPFSGRAFREHRTYVGVIPPLSPCAFCEQEGHLAAPSPHLPLNLVVSVLVHSNKES
jgi:hypothetical protein